ncbi:hypothetical protein COCVIDRAFT_110667, partial [Bipolaris victoriae FI3]
LETAVCVVPSAPHLPSLPPAPSLSLSLSLSAFFLSSSPPSNQNNRPFCHATQAPLPKNAAPNANANAHAYPSLCVCSLASNPSCILSLPF